MGGRKADCWSQRNRANVQPSAISTSTCTPARACVWGGGGRTGGEGEWKKGGVGFFFSWGQPTAAVCSGLTTAAAAHLGSGRALDKPPQGYTKAWPEPCAAAAGTLVTRIVSGFARCPTPTTIQPEPIRLLHTTISRVYFYGK